MKQGTELGAALREAIRLKRTTVTATAAHFGVHQSSVSDWMTTGRIAKAHLGPLINWFADVVGPDHWGLPITREEYDMLRMWRIAPERVRHGLRDILQANADHTAMLIERVRTLEGPDKQS